MAESFGLSQERFDEPNAAPLSTLRMSVRFLKNRFIANSESKNLPCGGRHGYNSGASLWIRRRLPRFVLRNSRMDRSERDNSKTPFIPGIVAAIHVFAVSGFLFAAEEAPEKAAPGTISDRHHSGRRCGLQPRLHKYPAQRSPPATGGPRIARACAIDVSAPAVAGDRHLLPRPWAFGRRRIARGARFVGKIGAPGTISRFPAAAR